MLLPTCSIHFSSKHVATIFFTQLHHTVISDVSDGKFGEYMQVNIQNDGPVTIELQSPQQKKNVSDLQSDDV